MERPLTFEHEGQRLFGLLRTPNEGGKRGIVLLHGWSGYRIGPGRLLAEAARQFCAAGYATLSFDFRGRGESEGEVGEANLNTMIADAVTAVEVLRRETRVTRVTLLGLCSGCEVAIGASLADEAIDSLALWSAPIFSGELTFRRRARRAQRNLQAYLQKLFRPETWGKLVTGRLNWRLIFRALTGGRSGEDQAVKEDVPATEEQMAEFAAFRGPLLFIYGANDPETPDAAQFYRTYCERVGVPHEFHFVAGANHNFYSLAWKREVIETTLNWLHRLPIQGYSG
ncbi:MAG TPA: alpha/beta fold hydrolase [Armatimonadetes bacterium]|nr:alpha/beta fold hydrolase [Armatimonadota bacterium]